jgi:hypothetical protein
VLAFALAAAMVVTAVPATNAQAASTAKLSAKKATVYSEGYKTVTVTTPKSWKSVKVTATSNKKSVATVKKTAAKKIKVTGVKPGTAKVTVEVTYKTSTKKNAKTQTKKLTYTMKVAKASVALSGESAVAVGSTIKLTPTKKASDRATITYTSSDDAIAKVDAATGVVTGVKAGKANIKATLTIGKDTATTTKEVEVKNYVLQSVAQTKSNTLQGVILGETKNIKATDIKITNTVTQNVIAVKNVTPDKADASKVTIETFADMKDGAKYTVELDGVAKEFTATDGVVTGVNVTPVTIPANTTGTEIKGQTVDKDNIVIDEFKVSDASFKNAELNLSTTQGYVDGDKLVLPTVGNKGTAEVKYHTYKFDANGNEIGAYTKKIDITAVAENAITTTGFNMTFADKINWDKDKTTNQLAIGSGKKAFFKFVGSDNKEITNYSEYSVVSSDDSILLLPKTPLTSSTTGVDVSGIKEGNAYINVLNKDGKVIKSLPVVVTATGKLTNVTLGNTSLTISTTARTITNSVSVKAVDQYNNDITASSTVTPTGVNADATKAIQAVWNPATKAVDVSATSFAEDGKTYTIKVEVKNGNVTVNRYFTVKTVKTRTDVSKATDLRVEVSGLKDGKVDMAVADDANATTARKTVTVQVAAYDNGAKIGYVENATYEINNDKQLTVAQASTGASISVVSCSAVGVVSKNLEAGKSYTVTVKTADAKKTFTTTFAVVDTQASATVKVTKKATTKTKAADILAETCEVTYDGKKLENPEFTVDPKDVKTVITPTATSTYIAKANVKVTNTNHITYTVPVTINTTFTK